MTANEDATDLDAIEDALRTGRHVPMRTLYTLIAELRSTRAAIGPADSERIRELEAENERLRRERDRARAMVPLPPPDPQMTVWACCGDTHPYGGPECSDG